MLSLEEVDKKFESVVLIVLRVLKVPVITDIEREVGSPFKFVLEVLLVVVLVVVVVVVLVVVVVVVLIVVVVVEVGTTTGTEPITYCHKSPSVWLFENKRPPKK